MRPTLLPRLGCRTLRRPSTVPSSLRRPNSCALLPPSRFASTRNSSSFQSKFKFYWEEAKRDYPIILPVLIVACVVTLSGVGYLIYDDYINVAPQYAAYPAPVEKQLRLALHYTHMRPDPATAQSYFIKALQEAVKCEMDPYSKEVMGIRIRHAEMLEKFGHVKAAVQILTGITEDYETKLSGLPIQKTALNGRGEPVAITRKALLRGIIESKVKIASLYESDYLQNPSLAKQTLSAAVELLVKESRDPSTNGFTEDNAVGLSMMEIASILSQMGDLYATTGEEANAVQVYMLTLQPLRAACDGTRSCKEVQLMSNIASTMDLAMKKPTAKINGKPVTKESMAVARKAALKWAEQAIATAEQVPSKSRDDICEFGLLSAQMTQADLLLDTGDSQKSKEIFSGLLPTLREKGLTSLVNVAEQGLKKASA